MHGKQSVQSWFGNQNNDFGSRIIATRLLLKDIHNKGVCVFLVSEYAPVGNVPNDACTEYLDKLTAYIKRKRKSDGNVPNDVCTEYLDKLTAYMKRKRKSDILIIVTDANSSMGTASAPVMVSSKFLSPHFCPSTPTWAFPTTNIQRLPTNTFPFHSPQFLLACIFKDSSHRLN